MVALVWIVGALPLLTGIAICPIATVFHRPCPGCGMTRAILFLLHGNVGASLSMHPLAVPTAAVQIGVAAASIGVTLERGTPFDILKTRYGRASVIVATIVLGLAVVLYVVRAFGLAGGSVPV